MKHKKLFTAVTAVVSVLIALSIFLMLWFWGDAYKGGPNSKGFEDFRREFEIPGLSDGACPQGITTYAAKYTVTGSDGKEIKKEQNYFFISSYFKDQPSRIYVVGQDTGEVGYVTLKNEDGSDYTGHCGGIATNGVTLWVSSDDTVYVAKTGASTSNDLSLTTNTNVAVELIKAAENNGEIKFTASFNANCNASFLYYYQGSTSVNSSDNKLYVGEFYRGGNYETKESHRLTTPNGDKNTAFAYEYSISSIGNFGLSTLNDAYDEKGENVPKIDKIFSITGEIQGFARTGNGIVLSQSYGLKNSEILYYSFEWNSSDLKNNSREQFIKIKNEDGEEVNKLGFSYEGVKFKSGAPYYDKSTGLYVYYIDAESMINDYSIPCMSEGLCTVNGRVYVLFESGANKYKVFVRQVLKNVYSIVPRKSDKF